MAAVIEQTPSPSTTKRSIFRKSRKGKSSNLSSPSLVSTSADDADIGQSGRRISTDSNIEGFRRSSDGSRRSSEGTHRLSKLLPGKLKRQKSSTADDERRNSLLSAESTKHRGGHLSRNGSSTSLNKSASTHSSLLTEDSEDHQPETISAHTRPNISSHGSHAGYLTVSSPQINAQTDIQLHAAPNDAVEITLPSQSHLEGRTTSGDRLTPQKPPLERRHSPVDRFKSALTIGKKKPSLDADKLRASEKESVSGTDNQTTTSSEPSLPEENNSQKVQPISRSESHHINSSSDTLAPQRSLSIETQPPATPRNTLGAPETFITPPTPTHSSPTKSSSPTKPSKQSGQDATSAPSLTRGKPKSFNIGGLTSTQSNSSLNSRILTPTIEETKTPGGSLTSPTQGGFFSSVFNAAQNAATQLSSPFQNVAKPKSEDAGKIQSSVVEAPTEDSDELTLDTPREVASSKARDYPASGESKKAPATLTSEPDPMTTTATMTTMEERKSRPPTSDNQMSTTDMEGHVNAVSAAYDRPSSQTASQATGARPQSVASQRSLGTDQSPIRPWTQPQESNDMKRNGSIRSKLSDRKRSRKRGSSVGTANTLAPTVSTSTSTLAPAPSVSSGATTRPTGFAVASSKRNKEFHSLFRSVPEDDYLIEDYSAALQRDILLHGRFYVSEGHVCFGSNILGWVTNLVIGFDEIQTIEKKNTAIVFPNAIVIQTLHSRNVFASFVTRDSTWDLLVGIWKASHPNLRILPNSVCLDNTGDADKTEKGESTGSDEGTDDGSDDVYDEDEEGDDDLVSIEHGAGGSAAGSDIADSAPALRKASSQPAGGASPVVAIPKGFEGPPLDPSTTSSGGADHLGPTAHGPTECSDAATHYDRPLIDTTIPAPLGKIYALGWGPQSNTFMRKFLLEDQKSRELDFETTTGLDNGHKTFVFSYIKPLNAPVGPRQTKCIVTATLLSCDLERSVSIDCSTQTPDVPSGNIFTTKTRYCLMWGPGNSTRLVATCTIDWTGKSWLKGPIEKGANDGQLQYVKDLIAALKIGTAKPTRGPIGKGKKGRKGVAKEAALEEEIVAPKKEEENWGLLEPLRPTFGPLWHFLGPFFTPHIVIAVLFVLLAQSWWLNMYPRGGRDLVPGGMDRMRQYEAMWAREEAELWDWLEERTGMAEGVLKQDNQPNLLKRKMAKAVKDERMNKREIEEAMRVTEERLSVLKEAVAKK